MSLTNKIKGIRYDVRLMPENQAGLLDLFKRCPSGVSVNEITNAAIEQGLLVLNGRVYPGSAGETERTLSSRTTRIANLLNPCCSEGMPIRVSSRQYNPDKVRKRILKVRGK